MKIVTDDKDVITAILYVGDAEGAIEVTGDVPADLDVLRYKYIDGQFVKNTDPLPDPEPVPENVLTQDDYNMDFDYRLSCLELGL